MIDGAKEIADANRADRADHAASIQSRRPIPTDCTSTNPVAQSAALVQKPVTTQDRYRRIDDEAIDAEHELRRDDNGKTHQRCNESMLAKTHLIHAVRCESENCPAGVYPDSASEAPENSRLANRLRAIPYNYGRVVKVRLNQSRHSCE